jgi:adenylate cyclase class 2
MESSALRSTWWITGREGAAPHVPVRFATFAVYCLPMSNAPSHREIEIKLRVPDPAALRRLLKRLGARQITPRIHEANALYDTLAGGFRRRGELLRIRTEWPGPGPKKERMQQDGHAILTYKAPVRSRRGGRKSAMTGDSRLRFKIKEEAEVTVVGAAQMDRILRGLGLSPQFRYEKYRTTYVLPRIPRVKIELDETPVGLYLELEGSPSAIDRAASRLGYAPSEYMTATYGALYLADCKRRGRKPGHMLFRTTKNLH